MQLGLVGKVALVTGASRGIGRAIALGLAQEGVQIALSARQADDLAKTAADLRAVGVDVCPIVADVATLEGAQRTVAETLQHFGRLDILVNNVGGSLMARGLDHVTPEQFSQVLDQNLMSAVWCSQAAIAHMKERGSGCIVHINSISGREYTSSAPYGAAKAALVSLTKEMGVDLAKYRIRVNGVAPGSILFPGGSWEQRQREHPDLIAKMIDEQLPWGRFGKPEEVADVVVFLCSERAQWVTGATLPVDGGQGRAL